MSSLCDKAVRVLASWVPEILSRQDKYGVFWPDAGRPVLSNTDFQQNAYYPLAYLFVTAHSRNLYAGDQRLLEAVERSIRNNLAVTDERGESLAANHDEEPYRYANNWRLFSWLRTIELMRGYLDPLLVERSDRILRAAIPAAEKLVRADVAEPRFAVNHNVRNHPAWHCLVLHELARTFGVAESQHYAAEVMERICAAQHPAGAWLEHDGLVTVYQHMTLSAISNYQRITGSAGAAAAIQRSLGFHRLMTYPSGVPIETLDGRVRYTGYVMSILPAKWAATPEGSSYLHFLLDKLIEQPIGAGYHIHRSWLAMPFFTQFIRDVKEEETPAGPGPALLGEGNHELPGLAVRVIRRGPWTVVLSGFTRPEAPTNRWVLDYQSHLSIHHERAGLIVGGGGSKRQAAFSLFTGASRPLGLPTLAKAGSVQTLSPRSARLTLEYDDFTADLQVEVNGEKVILQAAAHGATPAHLQLQFPMKGDAPFTTASDRTWPADSQDEITAAQMGNRLGRQGLYTMTGFAGARAVLFLLPFNTHWKNGWSHDDRGAGIVAQPLTADKPHELRIRA